MSGNITVDALLWVIAILLVPVSGAAIRSYFWISELVEMHRQPEKTGFGTVGLLPAITSLIEVSRDQTTAIRDLNALLIWYGERQGFGKPPPQIHLPANPGPS